MISFPTRLLSTACLLSLATPALAADGVFEINQAAITGFPYVIKDRGSYVLTSNLSVPNLATPAIEVIVDEVTIDLNGFTIDGPITCTGQSGEISCGPTLIGRGIDAVGRSRVTVRDGVVRDFGGDGIRLGPFGRVENVSVFHNGRVGIDVAEGSLVSGCLAEANRAQGFVLVGSLLRASSTRFNGAAGIIAFGGTVVRDVQSSANGGVGVAVGEGSVVSDSSFSRNEGGGISAVNIFGTNGAEGALIQRTSVSFNGGNGMNLFTSAAPLAEQAAYRETNISGNSGVAVVGGINQGNNICDGAPCP